MFQPYHANLEHDLSLVHLSIPLLEDLVQRTGNEPLKTLQDACKELLHYACTLSPRTAV